MGEEHSWRRTWALVCSTSRARILRGLGPMPAVHPETLVLRARRTHLRRLLAACATAQGESVEPAACLGADDRAFAEFIAELLDAHRLAGEFAHLAAVSPPGMLRLLQESFSPGLRGCLVAELGRDLVGCAEQDLRRGLARILTSAATSAGARGAPPRV